MIQNLRPYARRQIAGLPLGFEQDIAELLDDAKQSRIGPVHGLLEEVCTKRDAVERLAEGHVAADHVPRCCIEARIAMLKLDPLRPPALTQRPP